MSAADNAKTQFIENYLLNASPEQAEGYINALCHIRVAINDMLCGPMPSHPQYTYAYTAHIAHKNLKHFYEELKLILDRPEFQKGIETINEPSDKLKIE